MRRTRMWTPLALLVGLASCGGGGSTGLSPGPTASGAPSSGQCAPAGTTLEETAKNIAFEKTCLAVPADTAFTITFHNQDVGIPHNIAIFSADPAKNPNAKVFFRGETFNGITTKTYKVSPLPPGSYFFHCDVHPLHMRGTLLVT